jgi:hypothetical protein
MDSFQNAPGIRIPMGNWSILTKNFIIAGMPIKCMAYPVSWSRENFTNLYIYIYVRVRVCVCVCVESRC